MLLTDAARRLLVLRALVTRENGSNPFVTCNWVIEKIDDVMHSPNPESLLDEKNRATFHKLAEEVK